MKVHNIKPNSITMFSVLPMCVDLLAFKQGKHILEQQILEVKLSK